MLGSVACVAAPLSPSLAAPSIAGPGGPDRDDPIFAAIERHRAARADYDRQAGITIEMSNSCPADLAGPHSVQIGKILGSNGESDRPHMAWSHDCIDEHFDANAKTMQSMWGDNWHPEKLEEMRRAKHAELDELLTPHDAWSEKSGLNAADAELERLSDIEIARLDELDKTASSTVAGLHAYVRYRLELEHRIDPDIEQEVSWLLLRNAGDALTRLLAA